MNRAFLLAFLLVATSSTSLTACMSPEQLADTVKRVKERKTALDEKNPQVVVVYSRKDITKGAIIHDDDVEERTVGATETHMPEDAEHNRLNVILKKAKNNIATGQPLCDHDIGPLVDGQ